MTGPRSFYRICWLVTAWLFVQPWALFAETSGCDKDETCREHLDRALQFNLGGRHEEALREFRAAYLLKPEPRLAADLGRTLQKLGRFAEALDFYERGERGAHADPLLQQELHKFILEVKPLVKPPTIRPQAPTLPVVIVQSPPVELRMPPIQIATTITPPVSVLPERAAPALPAPQTASPQPLKKVPLYKKPWLWVTTSVALTAGVLGITAAAWPHPQQPDSSLPSYPFYAPASGGAR